MPTNEYRPIYQFEMERHVREALEIAMVNGGEYGISARNLLEAALFLTRNNATSSEAFEFFPKLLNKTPDINHIRPPLEKGAASLENLQFSPPLQALYELSTSFFAAKTNIWGRDYLTFALLADTDPSLCDFANEVRMAVEWLQDSWFEFIVAGGRHRKAEEWDSWRRAAGVPIYSEEEISTGSTYLFTWDTSLTTAEEIEPYVQELNENGTCVMPWNTGSRSHINMGERVFLAQRGMRGGLVGSGLIDGTVSEKPYRDPNAGESGQTYWEVPVRWDRLSTTTILARRELIDELGDDPLWQANTGGVRIRPDLADELEDVWAETKGMEEGTLIPGENRFAQTLSDLDHKNDWIGIRPDVEALSTLLAVNQVKPPLSIAIFGDWGSGKTFLMRKIQERVVLLEGIGQQQTERIASQQNRAQRRAGEGSNSTKNEEITRYCSSILQIEFNAWHYTESNLWASMVNHIFEMLQEKLTPEEEEEPLFDDDGNLIKPVDKLFEQLHIAQAATEMAEKQMTLIEAEVIQAENAVSSREKDIDTANNNLAKAVGSNVWTNLDLALKEDTKQSQDLHDALQHFGFEGSLESAQTIYDTLQKYRSASGRASELLGSLVTTRKGLIGAIIVALVILITTVVAAVLKVPLASIGATITAALVWVAERASSARAPLQAIANFDEWFSKLKQQEESAIAAAIAKAEAELDEKRAALSIAREQLAEAKAQEARAKADLKDLTARDQMKRFVDSRVTSEAYAQHLGIISMIRQDFEDLSDYMYRASQPGEARLAKLIEEEIQEQIPNVERIILYIDDLDRCKPERVVEVLEAIHLLLAFRLFVVVVAVDPRWVIESLRQRYPHLTNSDNLGTVKSAASLPNINIRLEATAHDYLEKIFHIPFWVKPIGSNARLSLIEGYLSLPEAESKSSQQVERQKAEQYPDIIAEPTAKESSIDSVLAASKSAQTVAEPSTEPAPVTPAYDEKVFVRIKEEREAAERKIALVEITKSEDIFLRQLAPYLGHSPRRIKRYANTYRLLKSGLNRRELGLFAPADGSPGDYQIVLVFLAIVTGAPSLAPQIFSKSFQMRDDFEVDRLIDQTGLHTADNDPFETANALGALKLLNEPDVSCEKIETWVPRVMRYAFRLTPVSLASV